MALVANGNGDYKIPGGSHTFNVVYSRMIAQICRLYAGLPDVRTLTAREIVFFYEQVRAELVELTTPRG